MENLLNSATWQDTVFKVGLAFLALGALILLWYALTSKLKSGSTAKYAYVAKYELKYFEYASLFFAFAIGLVMFGSLAKQFIGHEQYLVYFVGLVSFALAFAIGYGVEQYFRVYYPFFLEKKLKNIRFHPRKSPDGKPMKLLREHEEDAHMTKQMIEEEEAFTWDYDVWLEEESGFKVIERYEGHLSNLVCPRCEFRTLKDYKEEVLEKPGTQTNGRLRKHYRCSYCGHEEMKDVDIASDAEEIEMVHDADFA